MQILISLILVALLIALSACGQASDSVGLISLEETTARATRRDPSEPNEVVLVEPTLLFSETRPLDLDNYWVAWQDPSLGYIAASRVGVPVTVPNYPPVEGRTGRAIVVEPVPQVFSPTGDPLTEEASCPTPTPTPDVLSNCSVIVESKIGFVACVSVIIDGQVFGYENADGLQLSCTPQPPLGGYDYDLYSLGYGQVQEFSYPPINGQCGELNSVDFYPSSYEFLEPDSVDDN